MCFPNGVGRMDGEFGISEMKYGIWQIWKQTATEMAKERRKRKE